ncbi:[protein-PII] uridylyltransferase [uncultured Pseudodesulfovibrio sp.]|uniref:[protein-PII] uridylyltransferase n=1 Tax=uncultured Pseudodesulfovibrio sp. TaxID=2035858 RepID=UPI0029C7427E|nr:[protein-PII] uridylyltransferase [uncultured Pseudodesulfovibrio sp.]
MPPDIHLPPSAITLKEMKADLWRRAEKGSVGGFAWEYTHLVDQYFGQRVQEIGPQKFSFVLVAVGGYGRGRLCPGSDVDILVLFKRRIPSGADVFVQKLLFPLWDLGFDLGHGVRTVADCTSLAKKNFQVLASLMDARPLAGDAAVFESFRATFNTKVLKNAGRTFAESLREHNETRLAQYGDASGMLEPELKNGLGGLRDGQQVVWLSRVLEALEIAPVFLPEELNRLRDDQAFLNRVRTALHLAAGRKNDRLFFDLQPATSQLMGFSSVKASPEDRGRGVEFFLSRLHQAMTRIKTMRKALFQERFVNSDPRSLPVVALPSVQATPEGLCFKEPAKVTADIVLEAFLESARIGIPLTWGARRLVRNNPGRFAARLIDRSETLSSLVSIFRAPHGSVACEGLLETRLLPAIFPEFGDVEFLIQFNDYHVHPVGRHTMNTVSLLAGFVADGTGWAGEMASRVKDTDGLVLAGFFHDLGKGEPNHSLAGAALARDVLERYGCNAARTDEVAFLVEHHLLLPKTATRRDLSDERVAAEVAATVGSVQRLDMLQLLSLADSMATGPRAWNSWTQSLFSELYFKVANLLQHGPFARPDAARRLNETRQKVLEVTSGLDAEFVAAAVDAMPTRALLALEPAVLGAHISQVKELWDMVAAERVRALSGEGDKGINSIKTAPGRVALTTELTMAAVDQPGLFAIMAGAISLHGLNILAADIFTWKDGTVVDVFTVNEPKERVYTEELWLRISRTISRAMIGELDLAARLEARRNSPLVIGRNGPKLAPLVSVSNATSDFHTVIEVAATDRIGFLFDMARTLAECDISIRLAKITTIKGRAADVFHVLTNDGQRLLDENRIETVKKALLAAAACS